MGICFKKNNCSVIFSPAKKKRKIMVKAWCYEKRPSKLLYTSMANLKNSDHAIFYTVQSILLSKSCCPRRRRPEDISASMWGGWGEEGWQTRGPGAGCFSRLGKNGGQNKERSRGGEYQDQEHLVVVMGFQLRLPAHQPQQSDRTCFPSIVSS